VVDTAVREPSGRHSPSPATADSRWATWLRQTWPDILLVGALLVILGFIHADGMARFPARFDDEGTYMAQAWAVIERFDLANYTYWYDHPPLGWIGLGLFALISGGLARAPFGVAAGREMMLLMNLVGIVGVYYLARRLGMRRWLSAAAAGVYGLSPLGIFYHRMVLLDNIAIPLVIFAWALFRSERANLAAHTTGAVLFAGAVLVKETMLLFLPALAWEYWRNTHHRNRRYSMALTVTTFGGLVSLYPLFAVLRGELLPGEGRVSLIGSALWQLTERTGSGSVFDPTTPAHEVVTGWLTLDPWLPVAGVLAAVVALFIPRLRVVGAMLLLLGAMLLRPGYLPVMFVVQALPLMALVVMGIFDEVLRVTPISTRDLSAAAIVGRVAGVAAAVLLVAGAWSSYQTGIDLARTQDADRPFRQAQAWLDENVEAGTKVIADHSLWLDMVLAGHPADDVVWYYKLDTDPGLDVPEEGWSAFDYIVTTEIIRTTTYELPQIERAMESSEPVAVFGKGPSRVEIRRIEASA
jgi:hypothetical protein